MAPVASQTGMFRFSNKYDPYRPRMLWDESQGPAGRAERCATVKPNGNPQRPVSSVSRLGSKLSRVAKRHRSRPRSNAADGGDGRALFWELERSDDVSGCTPQVLNG